MWDFLQLLKKLGHGIFIWPKRYVILAKAGKAYRVTLITSSKSSLGNREDEESTQKRRALLSKVSVKSGISIVLL